jgi:hypothetical protein
MIADEIRTKVHFFLTGIIILGMVLLSFALIQIGALSIGSAQSNVPSVWSNFVNRCGPQFLLSIAFSTSLLYAVIGAIVAGSVSSKTLHPCFMCLFSTAIPMSMVGIGLSWTGSMNTATWLLYGIVAFLAVTSHCAQHAKKLWPHHYSNEQQMTGSAS